MKPLFFVVLLFAFGTLPATAQVLDATPLSLHEGVQKQAPTPDGPHQLHVTDQLARWPAARQAAETYRRLKAQGALPYARKAQQDPAVGDTRTFKVINFEESTSTNPVFDTIEFELKAVSERFYIWVEVAELDDGTVSDDDVVALEEAMAERTPEASLYPDRGIIEIDELVFGDPPDVDGDDRTDVLLVNIQDGYDPDAGNNGYVGGFVTSADLSNTGNARDVLYLDTAPGLSIGGIESVVETAAHEYQHLIHFAHDTNETTFVNEGLSEWAEILCGYQGRTISYLGEAGRYNVPLMRWSDNDDPNVLDDYQRAGLFTTYLAERLGVEAVGRITQEPANGTSGYRAMLSAVGSGLTFEELLTDFHVTNLLNDAGLEMRFGYSYPQRIGLQAVPGVEVDGRTTTETAQAALGVREGGVAYLVWENVTDLEVTLEAGADALTHLDPHVVAVQGEATTVEAIDLAEEVFTFSGDYRSVTIVLPHVSPQSVSAQLNYSATWASEEAYTSEDVAYDDGEARDFVLGGGAELLTRFDNPSPRFAFLSSVQLPIYYFNQFSNDDAPPASAPRDFTFVIRDAVETGEGTLVPGDILFTLPDVPDPRGYQGITSFSLSFAELDLADYQQEMIDLPNTFFAGYVDTNPGNDENQIVLATSIYDEENRSFLGPTQSGGWSQLWDVELSDGTSLSNTVVPIRVEFLVSSQPVATDDAADVPEQMTLQQNYPNPFNPTTTIRYALPQAGPVTLTVHDLLGREVATLVDGRQPAGTHAVTLEAGEWASGVYFYTLRANGQQTTRRMVLVK